MAIYPEDATTPSAVTYPGGESPFSVRLVDPHTAAVSWSGVFTPANGGAQLQLSLAPDFGVVQETYEVSNINFIQIEQLYSGMTWYFRLITPNYTYNAELFLDPLQQAVYESLNGWKAYTPSGRRTLVRRVVRDALGTNRSEIRSTVSYETGVQSGKASTSNMPRVYRRYGNLHVGWQYEIRLTARATQAADNDRYNLVLRGLKPRNKFVDIPDNAGDINHAATIDLNADTTFGFGFTALTPNVEVSFELSEYSGLSDAGIEQAFAITDFSISRVQSEIGQKINDVATEGSVASQLDIALNSVGAGWTVDGSGFMRLANLRSDPGQAVAYFADVIAPGKLGYIDFEMGSNTDDLVNDLTVTNHRVASKTLSTEAWASDDQTLTFQDKASIAKYGTFHADVEWALKDYGNVIAMRARELFAEYAHAPRSHISKITCNVQESPATYFNLENLDKVLVEFEGIVQESKVTRISFDAPEPDRMTVDIELKALSFYMVSETFADFNAYEPNPTFAAFNADPSVPKTFDSFNRTRKYDARLHR